MVSSREAYLFVNSDSICSRAPAPPQIEHTDSQTSLPDVDSPHISSVPSDYSGETDTQAKRLEREAQDAESAAKRRFHQAEEEARKDYRKGKEVASKKGKEAKAAAKNAANELSENRDNPVVIGNAIIWTVIAATLGVSAYKQHSEGKLNWKVAGLWTGAVGVFAAGDYYFSQYLFKNKYPRK